ncbi:MULTISPECIES: 2,3-butanediol dehydrogenase [Marinomonas]|uniref:2,3-butanediol dehydrogenase n=1 Tax=Marinomonas rhodophyticola TaxID=2992803 RepID=A0ABT3KLL0_9GAMM|nr:2,3-butanediol dehydrogenase [Marinomonas sp. KJ51-3]MCW4631431.1 2,3-butanediol dehydrogenase [Marinomonas sp. KJ51-3]
MQALRWHNAKNIKVESVELSPIKPDEVEVSVAYCGICGSDLHEYIDGPHAIPVNSCHPISGAYAPITLGHEFCGTVSQVGAEVVGINVGDRVAVEPEYRCGHCQYCKKGQYNLCESMGFIGLMGNGGFASKVNVPSYMLHLLPNNVSFEQAGVLEPAAVALHAINQSSLQVGQSCIVYGLGPIGLLIIILAKLKGIENICAVDMSEERRSFAKKLGATATFDAKKSDVMSDIEMYMPSGYDVAFEAVGHQATLTNSIHSVKKGGEVILVGLMGDVTINAFYLVNNEIKLISSVGYRNVYPELIQYISQGTLDIAQIVTKKVLLDNVVEEGFESLIKDKSQIKVLVSPAEFIS